MKSKPDPLGPLLLVVGLFALLHHVDHVLRVDHSGWPFQPEVNAFTYSLLVYPVLAVDLAARSDRDSAAQRMGAPPDPD